jgi:putative thioredoxin
MFELSGQVTATMGGQAAAPADLIKDTTTKDFRQDVMQESMKQPVLVDFWAPWCGPCKQLTPILEKVVKAAKGKVKLVKMNIDDHPQIAGQLGVQSIPAVFAFHKGQPVDGFMGALPESQLKQFVERLTGPQGPGPIEQMLEAAEKAAAEGDPTGAAEFYAAILQEEPGHAKALGGLAKLYVDIGQLEHARQLLDSSPPEAAKDAAIAGARAALENAEAAASLGDLRELMMRVEANPLDHQSRFDLAVALNAKGKREEATEHLIDIIRKDRTWNEDGARKQLLQFFEAWGVMDDATVAGRRALSAILFR